MGYNLSKPAAPDPSHPSHWDDGVPITQAPELPVPAPVTEAFHNPRRPYHVTGPQDTALQPQRMPWTKPDNTVSKTGITLNSEGKPVVQTEAQLAEYNEAMAAVDYQSPNDLYRSAYLEMAMARNHMKQRPDGRWELSGERAAEMKAFRDEFAKVNGTINRPPDVQPGTLEWNTRFQAADRLARSLGCWLEIDYSKTQVVEVHRHKVPHNNPHLKVPTVTMYYVAVHGEHLGGHGSYYLADVEVDLQLEARRQQQEATENKIHRDWLAQQAEDRAARAYATPEARIARLEAAAGHAPVDDGWRDIPGVPGARMKTEVNGVPVRGMLP